MIIEGTKSGTTDLPGVGHDHSSGTIINTPVLSKFSVFRRGVPQKGKAGPLYNQLTILCNICGKLPEETRDKRLVRDHNHETGFIRGLLCDDCNIRLGIFESRKHLAKPIQEAKRKEVYMNWLKTYYCRIIYHLSCNTGIKYIRYG